MGIYDKVMSWGYKKGLKNIEDEISKVIKKKRLKFLGDDEILFTYKEGKQVKLGFDKMASEMIVVGGWADQMATLGITHKEVKDILIREYEKQKGKEVK